MGIDAKVAKNIRLHLKKQGLTQEKLAYEVGMSKGYLSNFLNGKKGISLATLQKLATGLQVPLKELIP
ncbi:MAG TPA: helix-turn-helix transcriptional regulator [bacterium]|jgi:transcriptional regulator with XRE-family HTH domain|nr:helix-turn-helix transcriptional regulator [bacterium]